MKGAEWKADVERYNLNAWLGVHWTDDVPYCTIECGFHDGKRCELLGARPESVCVPAVARMGAALNAAETKPTTDNAGGQS